jgi:hypothetical protein
LTDLRQSSFQKPTNEVLEKLKTGKFFDGDDGRSQKKGEVMEMPKVARGNLKVDADEERKPRSLNDMTREARWLGSFTEKATY